MMTEAQIFEGARRAYEVTRIKLGLGTSLLVAVLPLVSMALGGYQASGLALGVVLVAGVGLSAWRGGAPTLAAMSGLKAGLIPLVLAHAANLYGHVCIPGQGCSTLCVPACSAGGLMAGLFIERVARRAAKPNVIRLGGAGVAFVTGALGCSCVGWGGMVGLLAGMALTMTAGRWANRPR